MPRHDRPLLLSSLFIAIGLSGACIVPDYSRITVLCPSESPDCPAGQSCVAGVCVSASDGAAPAGPSDASIDFSAADMGSLCPKGKDQIFGQARGCPGAFAAGKAAMQCPSGWAPCSSTARVDLAACMQAPGYFASSQSGYWLGTMAQETCGAAIGNQLFYGCGLAGRVSTARCGGMPMVVDVTGPWSASDGTLTTAALTDPSQGVLCCPP